MNGSFEHTHTHPATHGLKTTIVHLIPESNFKEEVRANTYQRKSVTSVLTKDKHVSHQQTQVRFWNVLSTWFSGVKSL